MDKLAALTIKKKIQDGSQSFKGKIISDSMVPIINIGDVVEVKSITNTLNLFDIVLFYDGCEKLMCHVFVKYSALGKGQIITKGYNNSEFDSPISEDNLIGVVTNYKLNILQKIFFSMKYLFSTKE